ncbi:hypothetical protein [Brachyspira pilosicoli]|uniref:hypothetical protein n=1 Tax=Brachyspira pilosicoli TaxID=52584 RepID=UPI001CA5EB6A|nr:hypothetical protein [Brachyspira pilosicoli]MBW5398271.1 hypothetical protein [Brachyspira pilosicoli]
MEGLKFIKIILFSFSILLLIVFFMSCQSPLFQTSYNAKNDLASTNYTNYYGQYISKNTVGQNPNEKLNFYITNEVITNVYDGKQNIITNTLYIWVGASSFPDKNKFIVGYSNVDGEFPHYAFNSEKVVGKFTIVNKNVITINFATLLPPYLNIQNVTCNKVQ